MARQYDGSGEWLDQQRRMVFSAVYQLSQWMEGEELNGVKLLSVSIQSPTATGSDYRAILKGMDEAGQRWVAFCNGSTLSDLHAAIANVGSQRGFTWREDKFAKG
jgi:hypothetical protein